jgi:hypothetical protein
MDQNGMLSHAANKATLQYLRYGTGPYSSDTKGSLSHKPPSLLQIKYCTTFLTTYELTNLRQLPIYLCNRTYTYINTPYPATNLTSPLHLPVDMDILAALDNLEKAENAAKAAANKKTPSQS